MRVRNHRLPLNIEKLESRLPLAGNVSAFMSGGVLNIYGDGADNLISIESFAPGVVQVRGYADNTLVPTSVNQAPNGLKLFYDVTALTIDMGAGNDFLRVTNLYIRNEVTIKLGSGADRLITGTHGATNDFGGTAAGPLYIGTSLNIDAGSESDVVFQSDLHITGYAGSSNIDLGTGNDMLTMQRPGGSGVNVEYNTNLNIVGGSGDDIMNLRGLISRPLDIGDNSGATILNIDSADIYGKLNISTGNSADLVNVTNTNARYNVVVDTNAGDDFFNYLGLAADMVITMDDGFDQVAIAASLDELSVNMGSGNDFLQLNGIIARIVTVHGDDGDDQFNINGIRANEAYFYGDKNFDIFREMIVPPNQIKKPYFATIERFETT